MLLIPAKQRTLSSPLGSQAHHQGSIDVQLGSVNRERSRLKVIMLCVDIIQSWHAGPAYRGDVFIWVIYFAVIYRSTHRRTNDRTNNDRKQTKDKSKIHMGNGNPLHREEWGTVCDVNCRLVYGLFVDHYLQTGFLEIQIEHKPVWPGCGGCSKI